MINDDQLIQQILEGDQKAFQLIMEKYQDYMYTVCWGILKNDQEAQEATQDTFVKMYRSLKSYNSTSKLSTWLYRIAYRTSLDYLRKRKDTSPIEDVEFGLKNADSSSERKYLNKELSGHLDGLINRLDSEEATVLRLFYLEEHSIKELEEITGLSQSNIKVKLHRSRKKLYNLIKEYQPELENYLAQ